MNQPTAAPAAGPHPEAFPGGSPMTAEQLAYRRARRAVQALRRWYIHLAVYLGVNFLIWTKFLFFGAPAWGTHHQGPNWPVGPTVIWGIALAVHGLFVWSRVSRRGLDWENRKVREYLDRQ